MKTGADHQLRAPQPSGRPLPQVKSLNYLNNILAKMEACARAWRNP
ncbi:MAG: hypothetical protein ACLT8E_10780 [Akkermansia sp.]